MQPAPLYLSKVRWNVPHPVLNDIPGTIAEQFAALDLDLPPGSRIAIAVGSRGVANLQTIVREVVRGLQHRRLAPFIVPAMGSHGGATADGQAAVLAAYGISESEIGCPIRSSLEVVELDSNGLQNPLFMDRHAYEADGIVVINRIKPHTDFHGPYESGLIKMLVIGLGKERQAVEMHRHGVYGLKELIPQSAKRILSTGKIKLGVGIVENAYDETARVELIPARKIWDRELELLREAHQNLPRLPVSELDILAVDRLGKDISGTGMDTNVIGRIRIPGQPEPDSPKIKAIWVSQLTPASHGNATGMGLADVVTERFREQIDFATTYKNIITSGFLERAKLPIVAATDQAAFELCHRAIGPIPTAELKMIRIQDTLHTNEFYATRPILNQLQTDSNLELITGEIKAFDDRGNLHPWVPLA